MKSPLQEIPGVGPRIAGVMEQLGALYVWRAAVYYAEHELREPEKLKWWYWKDRAYPEEED